MKGLGNLPPWGTALLTLGAIFLVFVSLPMIGSALSSESSKTNSSREKDDPPSPRPLDQDRKSDAKDRDVRSDAQPGTPRGPLPVAGGSSLPSLALGLALLGGGAGLLVKVGFTGERPWPGRYVRRID